MHKNHFCLIWKSNSLSLNKTKKELKNCFKVVDNVISNKHVENFKRHKYKPKKVQPQLTNLNVFNLGTFNNDKAVPCASSIYKLSKTPGKIIQVIAKREFEKSRKDCTVF